MNSSPILVVGLFFVTFPLIEGALRFFSDSRADNSVARVSSLYYTRSVQEVTVVIVGLLIAQMIIGHPNLRPTAKDLLSEGYEVLAIGAIALIASRVKWH